MLKRILVPLICLLLISACDNSEKEARTLLNHAIMDWENGDIELALNKFDHIFSDYINTKTATDALLEKTQRLEKYRQKYNPEIVLIQNTDLYSKQIIPIIEKFYHKHKTYPEDLQTLVLNKAVAKEYLPLCIYEKAHLDYGYKLDCAKASRVYLADREVSEKKARRLLNTAISQWKSGHIKEAIKTFDLISEKYKGTGVASESLSKKNHFVDQLKKKGQNITKIYFIEDFPKANITWGKTLNPTGKVPSKGFDAYYINTTRPNSIVSSQTVKNISIDYSWNKFHGIDSQNFGAYWVSDLYIHSNEVKRIKFKQSRSKTRLIIDGHIVYEGGDDKDFLVHFKSGAHHIEVEYVNNWHTTQFSMNFIDYMQQNLSTSDIKDILHENIMGQYTSYHAGVYESSSSNRPVTVQIDKTTVPIVLFLSSYETVRWNISNPFEVNILAIVYGSSRPGSTVAGEINNSILLPIKSPIGSYSSKKKCSCSSIFHCQGNNIITTKKAVESLTSFTLTGFTGKYSAKFLRVPETIIDASYLLETQKKILDIEKQRQLCLRKTNPDFEAIMEGTQAPISEKYKSFSIRPGTSQSP